MPETTEEISDVEIILKSDWMGRNQEALKLLQDKGLTDVSLDDANGMIEGTIQTQLIPELQKLEPVAYVRTVLTYVEHENG